jgi:putative cell wall-binding protein
MKKFISCVVITSLMLVAAPTSAGASAKHPATVDLDVTRLKGDDRYQTAVAISQATFVSGVPVVYLVTGEKFADALAASALAGAAGGAVLLTRSSSLPDVTRRELTRLSPSQVVVLGGTAAVSESVETAVKQLLPNAEVRRDAGATRFETAAEASRQAITSTGGTVYIGSGFGFTEVIAASVAAARDRSPVLLVPGNGPSTGVPLVVAVELVRLQPSKVRIVGGTNLVSAKVEDDIRKLLPSTAVSRIAGTDAYDTAAWVAAEGRAGRPVWVATGDVFADGLGGAAAAAKVGASLVMVPRSGSLTPTIQNTLLTLSPSSFIVLGGDLAVSPAMADQVKVHRQGYFSLFVDPVLASDANVQRLVHMGLRTMARYEMHPGLKMFFYSRDSEGVNWVRETLDREQCMNYLPIVNVERGDGSGDSETGCGFIMRMGVGYWDVPYPLKNRLVVLAHEIFHTHQGQRLKNCVCPTSEPRMKAPRWFLEGSAEVAGFSMVYGESPQAVRDLLALGAREGRGAEINVGFDEMNQILGNPYTSRIPSGLLYPRAGMAVWYLVLQTSFDTVLIDFYDRISSVGNFDDAFEQTFGMTVREYEAKFLVWIDSL